MIGIIGGSGLAALDALTEVRRQVVRTPYGDPSCALTFGRLQGVEIVFLARHGYGHTLLPHQVNYRANLWALMEAGVSTVLAVATVGAICADLRGGGMAVPDQLIDYTHGRASSFELRTANTLDAHVDFTWPYDAAARALLLEAARAVGETVRDGGCYGCTQGPRLETAAEIRRMARDGCDMVGMTGMPEALLARELGLSYAALCVAVNDAAGQGDAQDGISLDALRALLAQAMGRVGRVLTQTVADHAAAAGQG